jgi:hypothetical protein
VTPETKERIADRLELAASVAWLLMDFAWMERLTTFAVACALPATLGSIAAVPFVRPHFPARAVTAAMAAWAVMNALWMMSDLDVYAGLFGARLCFALGIALVLAALLVSRSMRVVLDEATRAFRRLRGGKW